MNYRFRPNSIRLALCLAFPVAGMPAFAAEPFPSLPPTLSTSVTPNIMLYIDTSGSMLQDSNNAWMLTNLCNSDSYGWSNCVNDNKNGYRTNIDSATTSPNTKMNIAKRVAKNLVDSNSKLRFGLFSFQDKSSSIGGNERSQAGKLRYGIADMSVAANKTALFAAIDALNGRTATPLGEGLMEITQYFRGAGSLYGVNSGNYTSPIQYRCQKNFTIVITDGDATDDQNLPGTGKTGNDGNSIIAAQSYTARNSAGGAVAKTFSVCSAANTVAADGYVVNCPATLEGGTTARVFTQSNSTNFPSAIRDVAMYGNVADLRVGGTDSDNKSFDDPKFAKQNMNTYTVGFSVANAVLPAAAQVGGGKYYTAIDEATLAASLADAVNAIKASTSNAGGLATTNPVKYSSNKLFQPVFNPDGWYGELRCYDIASVTYDTSGNIITGACTPNAKATIPAAAGRNIYSSKWQAATGQIDSATATSGTGAFAFTSNNTTLGLMTTSQKSALGSSDSARLSMINFLRGATVTGLRTRTYLMGDIIDSQPLVVAAPGGATSDTDYAKFKSDNASRNMVFIGANDGMMHAFNVSNMTELMGYIPSSVYPHLDDLSKTDYGVSGGTPHTYHVNGEVRQADLKLNGSWKTILVGGVSQGGQGFYALDATTSSQLTTSAATAVKWEWNDQHDSEMGYAFGAPLIYNVRTSASTVVPAVILVNGYENDYDDTAVGGKRKAEIALDCKRLLPDNITLQACNTSALFIVNADTGKLIKKISVPARSDGVGGLSSPAGVDYGQDGVLDYVYAGDLGGRLWRFDLTASDPANFKVVETPIFDAGITQPITLRPVIRPVDTSAGVSRGNLVMFGTGKIHVDADRESTTTQSFYAVLDDMSTSPVTVSKTSLVQRQLDTELTFNNGDSEYRKGTYRKVLDMTTGVTLDLTSTGETKKGWYLDFPTASERLVSSPVLLDYMVLFGTGIPLSAEKCIPGGKGWVMGLDPLTGGVTGSFEDSYFSFVDVKLDGESTEDDMLSFSTSSSYAAELDDAYKSKSYVSGFSTDGIPTELTYVANESKIVTIDSKSNSGLGSSGNVIALRDANIMAVFTGNAATGVTKGDAMGRSTGDSDAGGRLTYGTVGNASVGDAGINGPGSSNYSVQTTIWREVK